MCAGSKKRRSFTSILENGLKYASLEAAAAASHYYGGGGYDDKPRRAVSYINPDNGATTENPDINDGSN